MEIIEKGFDAIARSLREFGYPDVTAEMIREIHEAKMAGDDLPHGVIGMFAEKQLESREDIFGEYP